MKRLGWILAAGPLILASHSAYCQSSSPSPTADEQVDAPSPTPSPATPAQADRLAAALAEANLQKTIAEAQTAVSTARKTAAEAAKAATDAETAATSAKNGSVSGSTFATGAVTIGDSGPQSEAMLLVSRAVRQAGFDASARLKPVLQQSSVSGRTVLVVTDEAQVSTMQLAVFDVQLQRLVAGLAVAHGNYVVLSQYKPLKAPAVKTVAETARIAPLAIAAAADTALSVASKLGSFFMTDYKYGSVAVTTAAELYTSSFISGLKANGLSGVSLVSPNNIAPDGTNLVSRIQVLDSGIQTALADAGTATLMAVQLSKQAETDTANAGELKAAAARFTASAAASQAMIDATNNLLSSYFTTTADKAAPIAQLLQQDSVRTHIRNKAVVLLVTGIPTAAYYTKKNLWTFFGGMPVYTMGGTVLSYKLFDPLTGQILDEDHVEEHGGYRSVAAVEKLFRSRSGGSRESR